MYVPKVYRDEGGDRMVVANGGEILVESGGRFTPGNPYGGADYYVDGNVSATGDGSSWANAFLTLAEAIAASNISIALSANRWWARRNRIFVCGDQEIDEDLTVLPEKCDIIGVGSDLFPFPRIIGNHAIAAATVSVRFINCGFIDEAGDEDLFAFPAGCHGLQFIKCHFEPKLTGNTATCITITDSAHVRIVDCEIDIRAATWGGIFAVGISIEGTTCHDIRMENNEITATLGIAVASGANAHGGIIRNCVIRTTDGLTIDDNSDDFMVVDNRLITNIDTGTSTAGYDFNILIAAGNLLTGSGGECDAIPFIGAAE